MGANSSAERAFAAPAHPYLAGMRPAAQEQKCPQPGPPKPEKEEWSEGTAETEREGHNNNQHVSDSNSKGLAMTEKPSVSLSGTVEMIIKSTIPSEPEKAQIAVGGADHPYKIRTENRLTEENGEEVRLKPGANVQVTVRSSSNHCRE